MNILVKVVILSALLVSCAQNDDSSAPATQAPIASNDRQNEYQIPFNDNPDLLKEPPPMCISILKCAKQCFDFFPHTTKREIEAKCSATGGACARKILENEEAIINYNDCLALPASEVIDL